MKEFFEAVEASREEYTKDYLPELERARKAKEESLRAAKQDSMNRLLKDLAIDRQNPDFVRQDTWDPAEEEDDDDDEEINIIDKSAYPTCSRVGWLVDSASRLGSLSWAVRRPDEVEEAGRRESELAQTWVIAPNHPPFQLYVFHIQ